MAELDRGVVSTRWEAEGEEEDAWVADTSTGPPSPSVSSSGRPSMRYLHEDNAQAVALAVLGHIAKPGCTVSSELHC